MDKLVKHLRELQIAVAKALDALDEGKHEPPSEFEGDITDPMVKRDAKRGVRKPIGRTLAVSLDEDDEEDGWT